MKQVSHPYIFTCHGQLLGHYTLLSMLQKRLDLIRNDFASKSEYERNEIEIIEFETKGKAANQSRIIKERTKYFQEWISNSFLPDFNDLEKNYERDLAKAKTLSAKNPELKMLLDAVDWNYIENNIEGKILFHRRLKGHLK